MQKKIHQILQKIQILVLEDTEEELEEKDPESGVLEIKEPEDKDSMQDALEEEENQLEEETDTLVEVLKDSISENVEETEEPEK